MRGRSRIRAVAHLVRGAYPAQTFSKSLSWTCEANGNQHEGGRQVNEKLSDERLAELETTVEKLRHENQRLHRIVEVQAGRLAEQKIEQGG